MYLSGHGPRQPALGFPAWAGVRTDDLDVPYNLSHSASLFNWIISVDHIQLANAEIIFLGLRIKEVKQVSKEVRSSNNSKSQGCLPSSFN